jgi:hypothetical protein
MQQGTLPALEFTCVYERSVTLAKTYAETLESSD